jgi:hypothetical protein
MTPEVNSQVDTLISPLKMESRNLDYAQVQKTLVGQLTEYADKAKQEGYVM